MSTATAEPAQAVPEAAPATPAAAPDFDSFMADAMTGGAVDLSRPEKPAPAPATPAAVQPETPPAPVAAEPVETLAVTPPAEPKGEIPLEPEEVVQPGKNPNRIRLTNLEERDKGLVNAANIIAQTERIPFGEAWERVNGQPAQRQPATPPEPTEVEKLEGRQVEIAARLLEIGDDPLNADEVRQLTREEGRNDGRLEALKVVTGLKTDLAKQDAQIEQEQAINSALLNVQQKLHPDFGNEASPLFAEAQRIATDPSHPDYDPNRVSSPRTAWDVAKLAMFNLGMKPAPVEQNVPRGTIQPVVPPQPASAVRPAAPSKATAPAPPQLSQAEKAQRSQQVVSSVLDGEYVPIQQNRTSGRFLIL
jgi:hypothetical protein